MWHLSCCNSQSLGTNRCEWERDSTKRFPFRNRVLPTDSHTIQIGFFFFFGVVQIHLWHHELLPSRLSHCCRLLTHLKDLRAFRNLYREGPPLTDSAGLQQKGVPTVNISRHLVSQGTNRRFHSFQSKFVETTVPRSIKWDQRIGVFRTPTVTSVTRETSD